MARFVADVGNSRLKLARLDDDGRLVDHQAFPLAPPEGWRSLVAEWTRTGSPTQWAIASVNRSAGSELLQTLTTSGVESFSVHGSAESAGITTRLSHRLDHPDRTGVDRALAVLAAFHRERSGPGQVVLCGTALTVERIDPDGTWDGGAILPGLHTAARALQTQTAQLPFVDPSAGGPPPAWGRATDPAIAAGLFWGAVGALRELLDRQAAGWSTPPWRIWTGGDAPRLAPQVDGPDARIIPDLVLEGLALAAFDVEPPRGD